MQRVESGPQCGFSTSVSAVVSYVCEATAKAPRAALEALREFDRQSPLQNLRDRSIARLEAVDVYLEGILPNLLIQKKLDELGAYLEKKFSVFTPFHKWLLDNGQGEWYRQLALFLVKLPIKSACNIVQLLYGIVRAACCTVVHPMKSVNNLAKLLVRLLYELTKPETWAVIGAGCIGNCAGIALVTGSPISLIGSLVGAALVIGGVSLTAFKAALRAEQNKKGQAIKDALLPLTKRLVEISFSGFVMGLIVGAIEKALLTRPHQVLKPIDIDDAKKFADEFVQRNHLPPPSNISLVDSKIYLDGIKGDRVKIFWDGAAFQEIEATHPEFFRALREYQAVYCDTPINAAHSLELQFSPSHYHGWVGCTTTDGPTHFFLWTSDIPLLPGPNYPIQELTTIWETPSISALPSAAASTIGLVASGVSTSCKEEVKDLRP